MPCDHHRLTTGTKQAAPTLMPAALRPQGHGERLHVMDGEGWRAPDSGERRRVATVSRR